MSRAIIFRNARWRVSVLGIARLALGALMMWQSWVDPAWHTESSRGAWFNFLPPFRSAFMFAVGALLFVIGATNVWVVVRRAPALIVEAEGLTVLRVLQRRLTIP